MPRKLRITASDYSRGYKRFWVSLPIQEMERLVTLSGYSEPAAKATEWLRERIEKEYGNRREIPGQTHIFQRAEKDDIKKKVSRKKRSIAD